jgi:transcription elongation factor Elf1
MGRRRRRVIRIVKKKLPTVFVCPRCGEEAVRVTIAKDTGKVTVLCALCNLRNEFQAHPAAQPIDVYSYFTDMFYGVPNPRAIMPRDREMPRITEPEIVQDQVTTETVPSEDVVEQPQSQSDFPTSREESNSSIEASKSDEFQSASPVVAEVPGATPLEEEKREEEEAEPFADIMENKDKDKKRYSSQPLQQQQQQEQQTTEQSS